MAVLTLNFSNDLNVSVQAGVGDIVYYQTANSSNVTKMGECLSISGNTITCYIDPTTSPPAVGDFIFFAKENIVNTSGIIGYYADIKLVNHTTKKAEMFAISSGIIESSK